MKAPGASKLYDFQVERRNKKIVRNQWKIGNIFVCEQIKSRRSKYFLIDEGTKIS